MSLTKKTTNYYAFTLIELLVVIAIIAIITSLSGIGMKNAFESTRDAQRKSDLKQYQTALERQANANNGFYESRTPTTPLSSTVCSDLGLTNCPEDPKYLKDSSSWIPYRYYSNGAGSGNPTATVYVMWAKLENRSTATAYWVNCSNGKSKEVENTEPSSSTCPF